MRIPIRKLNAAGKPGAATRRLSALIFALVLFPAAARLLEAQETDRPAKRLLIISTGTRLSPGFMLLDRGLTEVVGKIPSVTVDTYAENLDVVRFPPDRFYRVFTDYLSEKYAGQRPDVIVLAYVGNLATTIKLLQKIFPQTPIIVAGYTEEAISPGQFGDRVSGVAQRVDPGASIDLILRLQPDTHRIVVVGGTAGVDRDVLARVREAARPFAGRVSFDFWDKLSTPQLHQAVASLPAQTVILFTRSFRDVSGQPVISGQIGQSIAELSNVPVYIMTETSLGTGAVGGYLASAQVLGKRAGELAQLILTGAAPQSLPFEIRSDTTPIFDGRALKRWGISQSRLPPNSIVRFKPQSVWQQYYWYFVGAIILISLQTVFIIDLLVERRRRLRTQAELSESREMVELAASAADLGLWARDLKAGTVWASATLRSMFGLGKDDSLTMLDVMAYVHPDDRPRVMAQAQSAEEADLPFESEFRVLLPDGRMRWVLTKGRSVESNRRRMGVILDVTDRKRTEEALRESEERFRLMADSSPVMIWMTDTNKLCTFVNKAWLAFTGRTEEQELGDGWLEGIHPDDVAETLKTYSQAFDERERFMMDYRVKRFDGEYRWVLDTGAPRFNAEGVFVGYVGSALDISERKRAAETLEQERVFLRQVIDTVPDFIFAKDAQGRFTLANQAVATAYGTSVEKLIGKTDADFNPNWVEAEFFRGVDQEVLDTLQDRFIPEERITDAHGNVRWLQTVKRPILEHNGSGKQVLGASTDITKRKETEFQLQDLRAELAHVSRMSTMGELSTSLAHELNQPLTAILSNAQAALRFLGREPVDLAEVREILQDIVQDNSRAGEVIRRMRALVKKEKLDFADLDLAALIRDVATLLHSDTIIEDIQIALDLPGRIPPVVGDRVQLQQVMLNLILNAFEAMKGSAPQERKVTVAAESYGDRMIRVAVRDGGVGVAADKLDKIFEPFYTTKPAGLGMGLSICRSIIEAHHGHLWAESNHHGRGATFYFTVPVAGTMERRATGSDKA